MDPGAIQGNACAIRFYQALGFAETGLATFAIETVETEFKRMDDQNHFSKALPGQAE